MPVDDLNGKTSSCSSSCNRPESSELCCNSLLQVNCNPMASLFVNSPLLHRAAPRLTKHFFTCQATQRLSAAKSSQRAWDSAFFSRAFRTNGPQKSTIIAPAGLQQSASLESLGKRANGALQRSSFPETSDKKVAYWLLGSAASVFGIVVFGGLTRLTESGYAFLQDRSMDVANPC